MESLAATPVLHLLNYSVEFSASHRMKPQSYNSSLFRCTAVKINSVVILSGID